MVDSTILNYLSQNKQFSLFELKNRVLASGYSESDFNEAVTILGLKNNLLRKKRFKWMLVAGIVGILLFLGLLISTIPTANLLINGLSLNALSTLDQNNSFSPFGEIEGIAIFLIFCLAIILFYFGFERMGSYTQTKTLKITSWIFIGLIILLGSIFLINSFSESPSSLNISTQNSTNNTSWISFLILGIIILLTISFGVSLILVGKKVKFAKTSGILEIVTTLTFILSIIKIYYDLKTNPNLVISIILSIFGGDFETLNEIIRPYILILLVNQIFGTITIFFQSISLFNASNRFE